ncbi:MAG: bifunctional UDP-N-acetylmuramoyl-tripeptide:D-alanyl-D-alanine ligase/alanine racemase [Lentimicrobiaceae bacterium]|nr:bifunctional UDP-N-acetylmuramoyl-tripeptide:D-alanyl-D-alanine ligase/alanine racemase [Lentimicrobiaceae bacterium]
MSCSNNYKISDIAKIINAKTLHIANPESIISEIAIDSRSVVIGNKSLFFAIKTNRNDGSKYIDDVYKKGVRSFVVEADNPEFANYSDANFLLIKNSVRALQQLAQNHRNKFNFPVVGITGSNGKTIVKEWLYQLLHNDYNICRNPKSYNSQIGVPLSVWQINSDNNFGIFEAGISLVDEMQYLQEIIKPTIGIFTNIGAAHQANFTSVEQKVEEKIKLFVNANNLIYCTDYKQIDEQVKKLKEVNKSLQLFTWSTKDSNADLYVKNIKYNKQNSNLTICYKNTDTEISIPFADYASVENAFHCISTMLVFNYPLNIIKNRLKNLQPIAMRLELKKGINNCTIINDSYSNDINSLKIALDFLNQQHQNSSKTVILSDLLQTADDKHLMYTNINNMLVSSNVSKIIGIGSYISENSEVFSMQKQFYNNVSDFLSNHNMSNFNDETILIKGARDYHFEDISNLLQLKDHETVLEIDINSVIHNLNYFRSLTKPGVKTMAMVKAFSYGSGSYEIANALQFHNVDYLAVAYADEGVELRKAGITLPIMVMNPEPSGYEAIIRFNLEPEIFSFRALNLLLQAMNSYAGENKSISIHVKIDTGMSRLGFTPDQTDELINRIKGNKNIVVKSIFSHLVGSDDAKFDDFTKQQISIFKDVSDKFLQQLNYPILRHISNSSAIIRFPEANFDMVRLGIGLYGINPVVNVSSQLQNVSSLKTVITQIKKISKNQSIGYSRNFIADHDMTIATLPIGYADGIPRSLENMVGHVYIKGKTAKIVGNICMDMMMVDITNIDANEGDEVVIFNSAETINKLAELMGTISYEVLTGISQRVKRVYFQD